MVNTTYPVTVYIYIYHYPDVAGDLWDFQPRTDPCCLCKICKMPTTWDLKLMTGWWYQIFLMFHPLLFGEDSQVDEHIFQRGGSTTKQMKPGNNVRVLQYHPLSMTCAGVTSHHFPSTVSCSYYSRFLAFLNSNLLLLSCFTMVCLGCTISFYRGDKQICYFFVHVPKLARQLYKIASYVQHAGKCASMCTMN